MSAPIPVSQGCCGTCAAPITTQGPQGPAGPAGPPGADGLDGIDAFTLTTSFFNQPSVSGTITVQVQNSTWIVPGQILYLFGGGYYQVFSVPNSASVQLTNLGYTGNVAPGTLLPANSKLSPGGLKGTDGADGPPGPTQIYFFSGDPNGVVTATRPALGYTPQGGFWMKMDAGESNTGWQNVIADAP